MNRRESKQQYTAVAKILHWLVAGMIVVQFVLAKMADLAGDADSPVRELALLANHKSVGITILALVIVRLVWRFRNPPPALPETMPKWQLTASHISHWSLYALLFAMPITGWLMSSASAYSVSWFNLFQLPDFVAPNPDLKSSFEEAHELIGKLLILLALVHIAAAVKHAVVDKDGVLQRIISVLSGALFVAVIVLGVTWLGSAGKGSSTAQSETEILPGDITATVLPVVASDLPPWQIDYATSYIRFIGDQAGAEFEGAWDAWSAELRFDAGSLDNSDFDVTVDASSANTQDQDRDVTLADPEWFDSLNYPQAYFRASNFSRAGDGSFIADGVLIVKSVATPVQLSFAVIADGDNRSLTGTAQLDRLALGVGTGEWEDTAWVSKDVTVEVHVEATVSD